ncbi:hypothetical protein CAPTEDRAFT_188348 [Capitella teleta]|uniref:P2X purinoreceptor 7 intracellular domain-containing protein n=1 Tax=Capitella teleta TaxID=283909 RepID=R7VIQ2_CAPTE|nr:hypothetical protein CAPTEDRAFT_214514 [Capitella teleta]ELU18509.1 hypothetical protein CAPTEDRAFT_188348 [Capitella teleta]|eukprot:ELU18459.1 hypothetical protein CAPTEDRAFT_214514 [Capitella teleta]
MASLNCSASGSNDCDLEMMCCSTESEESDGERERVKGAAPYMFEPLVPPCACVEGTEGRTAAQESHAPGEHRGVRLQSRPSPDVAVEDWCQCGHCHRQEKPEECQCCQEIRQTRVCITEYEGFSEVCLARHALRAVYNRYHQSYRKSIPNEENK